MISSLLDGTAANGTLAVLGSGGHGRVVAECAEQAGWVRIELFDDSLDHPASALPWPVSGTSRQLLERLDDFNGIIVGIGSNAVRLDWTRRLTDRGARLATLIHPRATVSPYATIGRGSVVLGGAIVNIGATTGEAVIINTGATIDHDCVLDDGVHVSPGAHLAGGVTVGQASWIGVGAAVRELIAIGHCVTVGAGAVVVKPVENGLTVIGVPARPIRRPLER